MRTRKEKPIFRGLTIAAHGPLGGSEQWTDTNITRWVTLREGRFARIGAVDSSGGISGVEKGKGKGDKKDNGEGVLGEEVTHVVCSKEVFWKGGRVVKAALKRGKTCEIVTLDWLEDSMLGRRRLPEEKYSHRRALKRKRERERRQEMLVKGLEKAVKEVNPNLYRVYCDELFWYEVALTRDDEATGFQERYVLSLFESKNASPHLYWFVVKFFKKKGDPAPKIHRPSIAPGVFEREFAHFQSFFQTKTGVPWAQRLVWAGPADKSSFRYQAPTGGKPVGWVPAQYMPAEVPDVGAAGGSQGDATAAVAHADADREAVVVAFTDKDAVAVADENTTAV